MELRTNLILRHLDILFLCCKILLNFFFFLLTLEHFCVLNLHFFRKWRKEIFKAKLAKKVDLDNQIKK